MKKILGFTLAGLLYGTSLILTSISCATVSSSIIKCSDSKASFEDRWKWATQQDRDFDETLWIGYKIQRLMSRNSTIGCHFSDKKRRPSLEMIIEGKANEDVSLDSNDRLTIEELAERALCKHREGCDQDNRVLKDVAILFYFDNGHTDLENLVDVTISNMSLYVDLKDKPLIWLGHVEQNASVDFLRRAYNRAKSEEAKEDLTTVIALHNDASETVPFLKGVVASNQSDKLRKNAVFWLGQQNRDDVLDFLIKTAKKDRSEDVRKHAVFAICQIETNTATEALIGLARDKGDREVQKEAIFWLGQKASKKSAETLEDIAYDENTVEIQKQAVFALSQLSDEHGIEALIKIANEHPSGKIRKNAIFWLGQSEDPRALDAIVAILKTE